MIEIVTHCYNPKGLSYDQHLKWQISSLYFYADVPVTLTVFYSMNDESTASVLYKMAALVRDHLQLSLNLIALDHSRLFRRSIGRNMAALATKADVVWFTDVDYCFGPGCLSSLNKQMNSSSLLHMPLQIKISTNHQIGQDMIDEESETDLPDPLDHPDKFTPKHTTVCVGGLQIIGGNYCRKNGYLNGTKWMKPVDPERGFRTCRGDVAFRRWNKLKATKIDIPNIYRIRHLEKGRDFDLQSNKLGRETW